MGLFDIVKDIGNAIKHVVVDPLTDAAKHDAKYTVGQIVTSAHAPPPPPPPPLPAPTLHIDSITVVKPSVVGQPKLISKQTFGATAATIPHQHTRSRTVRPASAAPAYAAPSFVSKLEHGLTKPEVQIAMVTGGVTGYLGDGVLLGVVGAALPPVAYAAIVP
jgi:hypothetical protein